MIVTDIATVKTIFDATYYRQWYLVPPNLPNVDRINTDRSLAHPIDIFSLAVTPTQILSSSGASSLKVHSTTEPDFPVAQSIQEAHKIGCHHIVTSGNGIKAASVGFGGELKIWAYQDSMWVEDGAITGTYYL